MVPAASIHLVARFRLQLQEHAEIATARNESLGLYGISAFYADEHPQQGLLFGYGGIDADSIHVALGRQAALLPRLAQA